MLAVPPPKANLVRSTVPYCYGFVLQVLVLVKMKKSCFKAARLLGNFSCKMEMPLDRGKIIFRNYLDLFHVLILRCNIEVFKHVR